MIAADQDRTQNQRANIFALMADSEWRTLNQIKDAIGGVSEAGVSARLRDLRKLQYGGYLVDRRRIDNGNGLHEYRLRGAFCEA